MASRRVRDQPQRAGARQSREMAVRRRNAAHRHRPPGRNRPRDTGLQRRGGRQRHGMRSREHHLRAAHLPAGSAKRDVRFLLRPEGLLPRRSDLPGRRADQARRSHDRRLTPAAARRRGWTRGAASRDQEPPRCPPGTRRLIAGLARQRRGRDRDTLIAGPRPAVPLRDADLADVSATDGSCTGTRQAPIRQSGLTRNAALLERPLTLGRRDVSGYAVQGITMRLANLGS